MFPDVHDTLLELSALNTCCSVDQMSVSHSNGILRMYQRNSAPDNAAQPRALGNMEALGRRHRRRPPPRSLREPLTSRTLASEHRLASCRMREWASGSKGFSRQASRA